MRIPKYAMVIFFALGLGLSAAAQETGRVVTMDGAFLRNVQGRDSILIGDQLDYGFLLHDLPEGTGIALPDIRDTLMTNVEIVLPWRMDTLRASKPRKGETRLLDVEAILRITTFEEGIYGLPGLAALRREGKIIDTLVFEPMRMEVCPIPVDTSTFEVNDIKGQIRYPLTFKEILPYVGGLLLLAALCVLLIWLIRRRRAAAEEARHREPAYIVALRKLDRYRGNKYWAPDKQKTFYSGITDTLREYMASRYAIGAMEMTTAEIFDGLKDKDIPPYLYEEMKELFERSDFVKFAKHVVSDEDNAKALPSAVRFVTSTYQLEVDAEADQVVGDNSAGVDLGSSAKEIGPGEEKEGRDVL